MGTEEIPSAPGPGWDAVPCNLCGADDARLLHHSPFPEGSSADLGHCLATTDKFGRYGTIVKCRRCGLAYTNPRMRTEAINAGYAETVDDEYLSEADSRSINAYFCLSAIREHAKAGRLLEVGSSYGYLLNAARIHFEVHGVELSRAARKYAEERLGLKTDAPTLSEAAYPAGRFDVAVLLDVIEHLPDPLKELKEVHRVTKPGSILYIVTPDISGLAARVMGKRWWGLRPAHIYYFDRRTMAAMLEAAGFEVLSVRSFGRIFTYGYWLSRLQGYPRFFYKTIEAVIDFFGARKKFVYIDTRDSMQVVARRKAG